VGRPLGPGSARDSLRRRYARRQGLWRRFWHCASRKASKRGSGHVPSSS
jgi:hypothetical protein